MEADLQSAASGLAYPTLIAPVLRDGTAMAAACCVVLALALSLGGCTDDVQNPVNPPTSSSTGTSVKAPAAAVVLAGNPPANVTVGDPYYYAPTVSQGSGPVSFSILGQPPWTSFDSQTGALAGTPTAADVGLSGEITITASNSVNTVSIGPFTIEVDPAASTAAATGSATLTWSPPDQNVDGSPLTNLAGYLVHYGTSETSLTQIIDLSDAGATTYVVSNLAPGTYYFAVSAYNSLGLEGAWSNIASKTL